MAMARSQRGASQDSHFGNGKPVTLSIKPAVKRFSVTTHYLNEGISNKESHMSNPCVHFLIAMGQLENTIRSVELWPTESKARQQTLASLRTLIESLAKQYAECSR